MKRSAPSTILQRPKKRQKSPYSSDSEGDEDSIASSTQTTPKSEATLTATTPATPLTPKSNPRFPSDLKTIACTYSGCKKSFNRPAKLEQHLRSHTNTRPFVCSYTQCDKNFLRQSHLSHHVKSAHLGTREYVCRRDGCGKSFVTATRLKRHEALHEDRDKFRCQATGCGHTFRKHSTLEKHTLSVHEHRKPFVCNYLVRGKACGAALDTATKLKVHHGRVHGEVRFWCQVCEPAQLQEGPENQVIDKPGFTTYRDLQAHLKTAHRPVCEHCSSQCNSQSTLRSHMEIHHGVVGLDERRTHVCPNLGCGSAFTAQNTLRKHIKTKHEGRQFICGDPNIEVLKKKGGWDRADACGQPFPTKGNLERHISTVHLGTISRQAPSRQTKPNQCEASHRKLDPLLRLTGENNQALAEEEHPWYDHRFGMAWEDFSQCQEMDLGHSIDAEWGLGGQVSAKMAAVEDGVHFRGEILDDSQVDEWLEDEMEMQRLIP